MCLKPMWMLLVVRDDFNADSKPYRTITLKKKTIEPLQFVQFRKEYRSFQ